MAAGDELDQGIMAIVGAGQLLTEPGDMAGYLEDWGGSYHGRARMVVRPANVAQVSAVVRLCHEHRVPIVPQGGNTGLCGGATPDERGDSVVLCLARLNRIRSISPVDGALCAEAGCVLQTIQQTAEGAGFLFPLSLGAEGSCQIGGNISTNAGGTAVLRYGPMRDLVLGLEVVLSNGEIRDWLTPLRKNTTGYDLKQLFIGAEGTLGIITAATLKLFPRPLQTATAIVSLNDAADASRLLVSLRAALGNRVTSFELINQAQVDVVMREARTPALPFDEAAPFYVLIEVDDTLTHYDLSEVLNSRLLEAIEGGLIGDARIPQSIAQAETLWKVRHSVSESNKRAGFNISHDVAVPLERQSELIRHVDRAVSREYPDARLLIVGHFGDGNLHVIVLFDGQFPNAANRRPIRARVNRIVDEVVLSLGGTISAEHGVGQSNKERLIQSRGAGDIGLMRSLKKALDEHMILNPGKIFAATP